MKTGIDPEDEGQTFFAIGNTVIDENGDEVTIRDLYYKGDTMLAELEHEDGGRMLHVSLSSIKLPE